MAYNPKLVRILWVDYGGILHCKVVPTPGSWPVDTMRTNMVLNLWGGISEGSTGNPVGEVDISPYSKPYVPRSLYPSRSMLVPWHPTHKMMFANMRDAEGMPWIHCARHRLWTAIGLLRQYNLRPVAGFELEFALLKRDAKTGFSTLFGDQAGASVYASAHALDIAANVLDEMVEVIEKIPIGVTLVHAECGRGQYEIVLNCCDVMQAVENVIIAREAVKAVARKHGLHATFAPVYGGGLGNGGHVHLSLRGHFRTDDALHAAVDGKDFKIGVDKVGQQFMAGIVEALPWLMFPCNSSPLSYKRVAPGMLCGATKSWGFNNRETPVRLVEDRSNIEVRFGDAISNPFHSVAAILTAGAIGVRDKMELCPPCQIDPQHAEDKSLYPLVPLKLEQAMETFVSKAESDGDLGLVFPKEVVQDWVAVRKEEMKFISQEGEEAYEKIIRTIF